MNANGRDTVALFKSTSEMRMIANRPPNIRTDRIIREFMICLIRSTSISDLTAPSKGSDQYAGQATNLFVLFKKVAYHSHYSCKHRFPEFSPHILYLKLSSENCIT